VIIVDGDKTSTTVDLLQYCESRGILVEEKFTPTNNRYATALAVRNEWLSLPNNSDTGSYDAWLVQRLNS
jgi:hypothetical protein